MTAYYNEIDPFAAQWLRELIAAGLIAPGDVDERSIEDVRPDDLVGYTQCHFFAGIGVWSYALRRAGWPDDAPVWTGSCPCQPFSSAGKRGGFDDERHLWPAFHWLIQQCAPPAVLGEQVASKPTGPWFDLVQADVEALGYAFGCVPFPSAGVGAPHIRDRAYWMANAGGLGLQERIGERRIQREAMGACEGEAVVGGGDPGGMADTRSQQPQRTTGDSERPGKSGREGAASRMAHPKSERWDRSKGAPWTTGRDGLEVDGGYVRLGDAAGQRRGEARTSGTGHSQRPAGASAGTGPAPTNGFWRDADWLLCRDGKLRPVEPGTSPLVDGAPARVGRLRGYGNAINAEAATAFIQAVMEVS